MKYVIGLFVLVSWLVHHPAFGAENPCECPKLACDSCSLEKGITFFSEKCGPSDSKIKSCARPTCVPLEVTTKECPVLPTKTAGARPPVVVSGPAPVSIETVTLADQAPPAGRVKVISGSVAIVHADGKKEVVTGETDLREGDSVQSGKDSGAVVNFEGGNKMHVQPDTTVEVKEFKDAAVPETRKALFNLVKGKIRNQVEQKYNGKTSYFKVMSKGAVAGVRGTDFVVSHSETGKLETRVETLKGRVVLQDTAGQDTREIARGEGAVFTAPLNQDDEDYVEGGRISEIYKIPPEKMKELDRDTRLDVARARTPAGDPDICEKPKAKLNQCLWKCDGNPGGEKTCRTDLPQVRCVRTRCNANGQWAEETRLPASSGQVTCPAAGQLLKDCDY